MNFDVHQHGDDYVVLVENETADDPTAIFRDLADAHAFAAMKNVAASTDSTSDQPH